MEDLTLLLVFERLVVAGQVELVGYPTMQNGSSPRGHPMGLLVFPFGVKRYEDHVMPIGSVPMPYHALEAHSGIFLPLVGVIEDSGS